MRTFFKVFLWGVGGLFVLVAIGIGVAIFFPSQLKYKEVAMPSGHVYKVHQVGPIFGNGWRGVRVQYLTETTSPEGIKQEAAELLEWIRPQVEADGVDSVVVAALFDKGQSGIVKSYEGYNSTFKRSPAGVWEGPPPSP
jgi:hypothetical protein